MSLKNALRDIEDARNSLANAVEAYTAGQNSLADKWVGHCRSAMLRAERSVEKTIRIIDGLRDEETT